MDQEYVTADINDATLSKIKELEEEISNESDEHIVLIAYTEA